MNEQETEEVRRTMKEAAQLLDEHFNPGLKGTARLTGFILVAFPFGSGERGANFISNGGDTAANVEVLKGLAERMSQ